MSTRIIPRTLGGKLKEAREAKKLFQSEVAERTGILQSVVSKYENDQIVKPTEEILQKFADLYEIELSYLTKDYHNLDHLLPEVRYWVRNPESKPFLMDAYMKYLQTKM
jgi:transcriptional regulator with XRE-family HTH domain